jgi:O-antigen biosynthesis protein
LDQKEAALVEQSKLGEFMQSELERAEQTIAYVSAKYAKARKKNVFRRVRYSLRLAFKGKPVRTSQYDCIRNSVFFDKNFYLGVNSDVKISGRDPVVHYLLHGAREGRDPGPFFSETRYRVQHPDVADKDACALEHYEWRGRDEGRRLLEHRNRVTTIGRTVLGNALQLLSASPLPPPSLIDPVDIVIPAYNCLPYLDPLFESLARNTTRPHRVIVVDNGNTDPRMRERLKSFVESYESAVLIRLDPNQGFVGAVNRAAEIVKHDFVLLNTDVVVPPHWLERLMAPLSADRGVASVTPFSNAATVCSFPRFCEDNEIYGGLSVEAIDRWFMRVHVEKIRLELPSGVGFCMAVNRDIWNKIGPFDEEAFRKGYGEENDWCLRAKARGYRNIIAPNLFAYHKHGGTFESESRAQLRKASLDEVNRRYPAYDRAVKEYIEADALRPLREVLAVVIACNEADVPPIVIIDHQMGGGANQYRNTLIRERKESGQPVLTFLVRDGSVSGKNSFVLEFHYLDYLEVLDVQSEQDIISLLSIVKPQEIFVNNLVGVPSPAELLDHFLKFKQISGARLVIAIHDYYCLCPSYTLLDSQGKYCGLPDISVCEPCLRETHFAANPERISQREWRRYWGCVLEAASEILCFSEDSKRKLTQIFPQVAEKLMVRPHELTVKFHERLVLERGGPLHIGVVGAIGPQKGSNVVNRLALHMLKSDPSARITVIGKMHEAVDAPNLRVTGPYEQGELPKLLKQSGVNACLLPSIWPETFSYVASELMALGVPLAVFDLGAPAERVRHYELGAVLDCGLINDPAGLYNALSSLSKGVTIGATHFASLDRASRTVELPGPPMPG